MTEWVKRQTHNIASLEDNISSRVFVGRGCTCACVCESVYSHAKFWSNFDAFCSTNATWRHMHLLHLQFCMEDNSMTAVNYTAFKKIVLIAKLSVVKKCFRDFIFWLTLDCFTYVVTHTCRPHLKQMHINHFQYLITWIVSVNYGWCFRITLVPISPNWQ